MYLQENAKSNKEKVKQENRNDSNIVKIKKGKLSTYETNGSNKINNILEDKIEIEMNKSLEVRSDSGVSSTFSEDNEN